MDIVYLLVICIYNLSIVGGAVYLAMNKHPWFALILLFYILLWSLR